MPLVTSYLVPYSATYNPSLLVPLPIRLDEETSPTLLDSLAFPVGSLSDVADRNWKLSGCTVSGTLRGTAMVTGWAGSLGSFVAGTPDPVQVELAVTLTEQDVPVSVAQPNFVLSQNPRETILNWNGYPSGDGVYNTDDSAVSSSVFPFGFDNDSMTDVGGCFIRARPSIDILMSPYVYQYNGEYWVSLSALISVQMGIYHPTYPNLSLTEGTTIDQSASTESSPGVPQGSSNGRFPSIPGQDVATGTLSVVDDVVETSLWPNCTLYAEDATRVQEMSIRIKRRFPAFT